MKNYKLFANMLLAALCLCLASCNKEEVEKPTSDKITTGKVNQITTHSATLSGDVNVDIKGYNTIKFGIMLSDNLQDLNDRTGEIILYPTLNGTNYAIEVDDLEDNTQYYYCAFVLLNDIQFEYGAIKDFTTDKLVIDPCPFPVSDSKSVYFSKGNLRDDWSFAKHQYEMNSNYLFYTYNDYGSIENTIDDGYAWYTLSNSEWNYLLNERYDADELIGVGCIQFRNGTYINGLILLPYASAIPTEITFHPGFTTSYNDYTQNIYTISKWQEMESRGIIFFPTTSIYEYTDTDEMGIYGPSMQRLISYSSISFNSHGIDIGFMYSEHYAIRLVRDATSN